jgi:hypothetical protein
MSLPKHRRIPPLGVLASEYGFGRSKIQGNESFPCFWAFFPPHIAMGESSERNGLAFLRRSGVIEDKKA